MHLPAAFDSLLLGSVLNVLVPPSIDHFNLPLILLDTVWDFWYYSITYLGHTVEPPIKDTPNKGHNRNKGQVSNRDFPNTLLTSDEGQPLNIGQNGQKTMGPKRVCYSEVPLHCLSYPLPSHASIVSVTQSNIHCPLSLQFHEWGVATTGLPPQCHHHRIHVFMTQLWRRLRNKVIRKPHLSDILWVWYIHGYPSQNLTCQFLLAVEAESSGSSCD